MVLGAADASVPFPVELGLTLLHTVLYAGLFFFAYLQLWLLLYYREKRLSYRTVCLFLCLLWAALRTVLFSFCLQTSLQGTQLRLQPFPHWLLFCFPVCLLFATVCLLSLYFAESYNFCCGRGGWGCPLEPGWIRPFGFGAIATAVLISCCGSWLGEPLVPGPARHGTYSSNFVDGNRGIKVIFKVKCAAEFNKYKALLYMGSIFTSLLFIFVNLTCALLARDGVPENQLRWTVFTRALINDSLFILCAVLLACCMCKLAKMSSANVYLESKGTSICQALLVGSVVVLLYSSRAFYNLIAVAISPDHVPSPFNYGWDNLSDKVRGEEVSSEEYVVFGVVLFLWEFVPTTFVVLFFRAQRLAQNLTSAGMVNSHSYSSRAYFFDNPRRYDSDDDLPRLGGGRSEGGSLATPQSSSWYGSLTGSDSCVGIPPLAAPAVDVAPLLFTRGALDPRSHTLHLTPQN